MPHVIADRPLDPVLETLLKRHPEVVLSESTSPEGRLSFQVDGWRRSVVTNGSLGPLAGLVELMDNNPMVCADSMAVPDPASTLALIALGPVLRAGIVVEPPVFLTNAPGPPEDWTSTLGHTMPVQFQHEERDMGSVLAGQAMAVVATPGDLSSLDELFDEAYGRTFYVRGHDDGEWHASAVQGRPWAAYRLRVTPDEPHTLLTVLVMADRDGKCGAAQIVHAMNLMVGLEECLGIPETLPPS